MKKVLSASMATIISLIAILLPSIAHASTAVRDTDGAGGAALPCVYLMGDFNNFLEPDPDHAALYEPWALPLVSDGVYEGTVPIPASRFSDGITYFRIVIALTGWETGDFLTTGSAMLFDAAGEASAPLVGGTDDLSWLVNWSSDADVTFRVDMRDRTLTVTTDPSRQLRYLCLLGAGDIDAEPVQANIGLYRPWFLYERDGSEGIYDGRFEVAATDLGLGLLSEFAPSLDGMVAMVPEGDGTITFDSHGICEMRYAEEWATDENARARWTFDSWPGGEIDVTVDTARGVVRFYAPYMTSMIYLIGDPNGNIAPIHDNIHQLESWALPVTTPGSGIYEGILEIPEAMEGTSFRFYDRLTGWGYLGSHGPAYSYGKTLDLTLPKTYGGIFYEGGEGCWRLLNWPGGYVKFSVNIRAGYISMANVTSAIDDVAADVTDPVVTVSPGLLTINATAPCDVAVYNLQGIVVHQSAILPGTTEIPLPSGLYIVNRRVVRL
ncbi:MAG: T9SS type A sorting domain-containing protein [Pseudoflavonifractor sp.]|nr:T9SS type A sorting domain-containing protein [Pseudoflavonifractor sp.]